MAIEYEGDVANHPVQSGQSAGLPERRALLAGIGGFAVGSLLAGAKTAQAGPLNPPPGPVASTGRTLLEIEPRIPVGSSTTPGDAGFVFRISQPGTYYLTQDVIGSPGRTGILINASNVTLDLNGFSLRGTVGSASGILVSSATREFRVSNGNIAGWGQDGLRFAEANGILFCDSVSFRNNAQSGLNALTAVVVANYCAAVDNAAVGFIASGIGSVMSFCSASNNGTDGIIIGFGGSLANCTSYSNDGFGLRLGIHSTAVGCTAGQNGSGVSLGTSAMMEACTIANSLSIGVIAPNGNRLSNCVVRENQGIGIDAGVASTISGCSVISSGIDGIRVNRRCLVDRNLLVGNGTQVADGAGIRVNENASHIRDNTCYDNDIGIWVVGSNNIIQANRCGGNTTNWNVAAFNACFVVNASPSLLSFTGNSGGVTWGSNDPNANFSV